MCAEWSSGGEHVFELPAKNIVSWNIYSNMPVYPAESVFLCALLSLNHYILHLPPQWWEAAVKQEVRVVLLYCRNVWKLVKYRFATAVSNYIYKAVTGTFCSNVYSWHAGYCFGLWLHSHQIRFCGDLPQGCWEMWESHRWLHDVFCSLISGLYSLGP